MKDILIAIYFIILIVLASCDSPNFSMFVYTKIAALLLLVIIPFSGKIFKILKLE